MFVCRAFSFFVLFFVSSVVRWDVTGAEYDDDDGFGARRAPFESHRRGACRASDGDGAATRSRRRDGERAGDGERGDARGGVAWGVCVV